MKINTLFGVAAVAALALPVAAAAIEAQAATGTTAIATVVPTDIRTTWETLLRELGEGEFTINATIKESSTIRVLLQSKIPSTWVDCGNITVSSQHEIFGNRSYNFLAANSVRYMVAHEELDELIDVERRTSLNALASIKLTPQKYGTQVHIEAHYVMKFRTREFGKKIEPRELDESLDFTSASSASATEEIREGASMKTVAIDCRPTGELERRIVAIVGPPAS